MLDQGDLHCGGDCDIVAEGIVGLLDQKRRIRSIRRDRIEGFTHRALGLVAIQERRKVIEAQRIGAKPKGTGQHRF